MGRIADLMQNLRPGVLVSRAAIGIFAAAVSGLVLQPSYAQSQARDIRVAEMPYPASATAYRKSWAVLIGIDDYDHPAVGDLAFAEKDVDDFARLLPRLGFPEENIMTLKGSRATRARILSLLGDELPRKVGPDDRVLVYFSGHGKDEMLKGQARGYLIPVDGDPNRLYSTGVSVRSLREIGERVGARHLLYVADACYSGFLGFNTKSIHNASLLNELMGKSAIQMITAGTAGQQALEKDGNGLFTRILMQGLEGAADRRRWGWVDVTTLGSYVRDRVFAESRGRQRPVFKNLSGDGEFVFVFPAETGGPLARGPGVRAPAAVERLLAKARTQIALNNLTSPPGDNAHETLRAALALAPDHPKARVQMESILDHYKTRTREHMERGEFERAAGFLQRGRLVAAEDPALDTLATQLAVRRREARQWSPSGAQRPLEGMCAPGMVWIPAGDFALSTEGPGRFLDAFCIDMFEVAVADYLRCVERGGCRTEGLAAAKGCNWGQPDRARHPINCVSWQQARDYCAFHGKRLAAEAEWEKAARGMEPRSYPWGSDWDPRLANANRGPEGGTAPVGSYPRGTSPYVVHDMAGNVAEWVSPSHSDAALASGSGSVPGMGVLRGGSWQDLPRGVRIESRTVPPLGGERRPSAGFRCAG